VTASPRNFPALPCRFGRESSSKTELQRRLLPNILPPGNASPPRRIGLPDADPAPFFAAVRDIVGNDAMTVELDEGTTASALWATLRSKHDRLAPYTTPPMVAINQEYADPDARLREGDEVAFIPPASGG
jgi:molybdopterin converting factor subunit 1